jgi:citrate lyase subunit beta/citryl-CoA lyase
MPGTNARAHDKARELACDVVIFDLEDSVASEAKAEARHSIVACLEAGGYGARELVVRVNHSATEWGRDDLVAVARAGAQAVLLPKVTGAEEVRVAGRVLDDLGVAARLWAMMETARGVLDAPAIAQSHPRLALFAMGLEDFAKELHADTAPPRTAMLYALERTVLVARAFGLGVLDGVYPAFDDDAGFAAACAQGAALGFDGKQLIHPRQIATANAAFAPSPEAVAEAHRIIAAFEAARERGAGIAVLDGRMIEALHVDEARALVAFAEKIAARG